jgi:hypothetical protein
MTMITGAQDGSLPFNQAFAEPFVASRDTVGESATGNTTNGAEPAAPPAKPGFTDFTVLGTDEPNGIAQEEEEEDFGGLMVRGCDALSSSTFR